MSTQAQGTRTATRLVRVALASAVAGLLALVSGGILLGTDGSASADPPGSNGEFVVTAQVDTFNPAMDPHLPCDVRVWFYGFDEGEAVESVVFTPWAPTAGTDPDGVTYTVTATGPTTGTMAPQDEANHQLNLFLDYSLAWTGAPHPQQGYNVKLDVVTGGTQHKSKVFWVTCEAPEPTPTETPTVTPTETPTETPTQTPTQTPETVQPVVPPVTPTPSVTGTPDVQVEGSEAVEPNPTGAPGQTVKGSEAAAPDQAVAPDQLDQPPLAVDAGLSDGSTAQVWGAGLVAVGLVLLLGSGGILVGARRLERA